MLRKSLNEITIYYTYLIANGDRTEYHDTCKIYRSTMSDICRSVLDRRAHLECAALNRVFLRVDSYDVTKKRYECPEETFVSVSSETTYK